jgi:hypothetical protein
MQRECKQTKEYEKEILELKEQRLTLKEIGDSLGYIRKQVHNLINSHYQRQRKFLGGIDLKQKGRPPMDNVVSSRKRLSSRNISLPEKKQGLNP